MQKNVIFDAQLIEDLCSEIFVRHGVESQIARRVCHQLILNQNSGYPSHGLLRIPEYLDDLINEKITGSSRPIAKDISALSCIIEGNRSFGVMAADAAARAMLSILESMPVAVVSIRNSHHIGRLASIAEMVLSQKDVIILGFCNCNGHGKKVSPPSGGKPLLATNPLLFALPNSYGHPMVLDMTTSNIAEGKIRNAWKNGEAIPSGWIQDIHGRAVTDANTFFSDKMTSFLSPLGGQMFGHKGFSLGVASEILSSCLSNAGNIHTPYVGGGGNSGVFIALSPDILGRSVEDFKKSAEDILQYLNKEGLHIAGWPRSEINKNRVEVSPWFIEWLRKHSQK